MKRFFFTLLVKKNEIDRKEKVINHMNSLGFIQSKLFMLCLIFFFFFNRDFTIKITTWFRKYICTSPSLCNKLIYFKYIYHILFVQLPNYLNFCIQQNSGSQHPIYYSRYYERFLFITIKTYLKQSDYIYVILIIIEIVDVAYTIMMI